jgi:gliding motility-associated-like protein
MRNDSIYVKITGPNGCLNFDTMAIIIHPLPEGNVPLRTSVCMHDTLHLSAGTSNNYVTWYNSNNEILSSNNNFSYQVNMSGKIYSQITDNMHCTHVDTINIQMLELPYSNAGRDTVICIKTKVQLGGFYKNPEDFKFEWSPANLLDDKNQLHPLATPVTSTRFIMKITDNNACSNFDTVRVNINPKSKIDTGSDIFICHGKSAVLGGNPTASGSQLPYAYNWFPVTGLDDNSMANPIATPETTTRYRLVVSTAGCIEDTVYVNVNVWPSPVIAKSDDVVIGYKGSARIWALGGLNYRWTSGDGLNDSNIPDPVASPLETTTYTVTVSDINGCEATAHIKVTVANEIFVPNLFTPNGDGKNDYFQVYGTGIDKIRLSIYNIEGILVYETTSIYEAMTVGWDGTYKGNQLQPGKYLWVIEAKGTDGLTLLYNGSNKGVVTLLR